MSGGQIDGVYSLKGEELFCKYTTVRLKFSVEKERRGSLMKRRFAGSLLVFFVLYGVCTGCATKIPVTVTKPAEINMASTRKIALLDFPYVPKHETITAEDLFKLALKKLFKSALGGMKTIQEEVEEYVVERFILTLVQTNYFHVVGTQEIREELERASRSDVDAVRIGKAVGAQAIIHGEIYLMKAWDDETVEMEDREDSITNQNVKVAVTWVTRRAEIGLKYYVVNTETGIIIANRSFESSSESREEKENTHYLPDPLEMYKGIIDSFMSQVARQLAPYRVQEARRLMKDKNPQMKAADRYVKGGIYDSALDIYLDVWKSSKNVAAGYNAVILYEVTGDLDAGITLMKQVVDAHPERRIMKEYNRMLNAKQEQERLLKQLS